MVEIIWIGQSFPTDHFSANVEAEPTRPISLFLRLALLKCLGSWIPSFLEWGGDGPGLGAVSHEPLTFGNWLVTNNSFMNIYLEASGCVVAAASEVFVCSNHMFVHPVFCLFVGGQLQAPWKFFY